MKCTCWDYWKVHKILPVPKKEYEICYEKNYREYNQNLEAPWDKSRHQETEKISYDNQPLL
jgi:hypothetical protein